MSIGKMFMSALIAEGSVAALLQYGDIDHLFKASELEPYQFLRGFVKQFQALPSAETIEAHTGQALVEGSEPAAYYYALLEARHIEATLKQGMKKASDLLQPEAKDPAKALDELTQAVSELARLKTSKMVVDFRDAYGLVMVDYANKWNKPDEMGLRFGWPTLDVASGGLSKGDLISFVGRPAAGKTWQMLYGAHYGWAKAAAHVDPEADQSRLFVSMEMAILPIEQRLAAMQAHVPAMDVKHGGLVTKNLNKLKHGLTEIQGYGAPFWIVDGNLAATVEEIWMLVRQLKPAAVFIDGAYLVKHPTERDRYRRVAENVELIKQEIAPLAPVACSWQFAKSATKKKKGDKVTGDDIGYSDAIYQVSSLVLGLFEEDSVETLKQRKVEILKGRSGEVGSFRTRWNFDQMLFDEIFTEEVEELQFV